MNLAGLSIKRPVFITCIVTLIMAVGLMSIQKLAVDLFPSITFPYVRVLTAYPGAGPAEVETLVSKVLEDEMSTVPGVKTLSSINREGMSIVFAEFTLETDVKYAEQQVRDRVSSARIKLPMDIKEPQIRRMDPADQPILIISVTAELPPAKLFDFADQVVRPKFEQISQVGLVELTGGRKREIHVNLDKKQLKRHELSATLVASRLGATGQNIPAGSINEGEKETSFRTLGEFTSLKDVGATIVSFLGSDVPVKIDNVGTVEDSLEDETSRSFLNGKQALFVRVYRQSGANTVAVADAVKARAEKINEELGSGPGHPKLEVVRDGAKPIRANLDDVKESIMIGIILTILVVFFFLGNVRSTLITGLALPNSLLGAFILMSLAGFSINVMTLLAMSLAVGLLIDDAIVVRENIFRHVEMGKSPKKAALEGTTEVTLAVIATTMTVIAVFGPIGFLQGVVGQFFKEFGLTICFAMAISLFDALTVAPMLSAYFVGQSHLPSPHTLWGKTVGRALRGFDAAQSWMEVKYGKILEFTLRHPLKIIGMAIAIFIASIISTAGVPKSFMTAADIGEFQIVLDMPAGTSLEAMHKVANEVDAIVRANPEVATSVMTVGSAVSGPNQANFFVNMVPAKQRKINTLKFKERMRQQLTKFSYARPKVQDIDMMGGGMRPFSLNIAGNDLKELEQIANAAYAKLKNHPGLIDVDINYQAGKPELQVALDTRRAEQLGVSSSSVGLELRALVEGVTPAVFREDGKEYDIRVRLREGQRNLRAGYNDTFVPNINHNLVRLNDIAKPVDATGPAEISRQDRSRYIRISGDIAPKPGLAAVVADVHKMFKEEIKLPDDVRYRFVGQAESFVELMKNMVIAAALGVLFIYLVLASLYESFIIPFTIMLVLPLAAAGAFFGLLITRQSLDLFSMIGCVMLLGIATKNSILLVDYTNQLIQRGMERSQALIEAGKARLRPILMTTVALIAGMLPVAIGLNEASRQRTSMGVAIIGGLISSTLLTLVVVPAAFSYIDRFRIWSGGWMTRLFAPRHVPHTPPHAESAGELPRPVEESVAEETLN
ncbi:MAG: efflux RND transporter permease subunit [Oligoflexia bacterium]|nr:efflux RND transporter permease subunit [Oligoflexia bacterium]